MPKPDLPIFDIESRLRVALTTQKRLVLSAPTGSGKSTQVPQMLLDGGLLGDGQVMVLQPRRLPTRMTGSVPIYQSSPSLQRFGLGFAARGQNRDFPASLVRNNHSEWLAVAFEQRDERDRNRPCI